LLLRCAASFTTFGVEVFLPWLKAGVAKHKARLKIVRNVTVLNLCIGNNITDKLAGHI